MARSIAAGSAAASALASACSACALVEAMFTCFFGFMMRGTWRDAGADESSAFFFPLGDYGGGCFGGRVDGVCNSG